MAEADFTLQDLSARFFYDAATGSFYKAGKLGKPLGRLSSKGYRQIFTQGTWLTVHRMVWLFENGSWPAGQIDHWNQNKGDNRIGNLRIVTNKQNAENITMFKHNTSGRRGVRWRPGFGKWIAEIKHFKKSTHLGVFDNIIDAVAARMRAERELFTHSPTTHDITHSLASR